MLCSAEQLRSSGGSDMKPAMQSSNSGLMRDVANDFHEVMNAQTPLVVITKAQSVDKAKLSSAPRAVEELSFALSTLWAFVIRAELCLVNHHLSLRQGDWSRRRSRLHPSPGLRI